MADTTAAASSNPFPASSAVGPLVGDHDQRAGADQPRQRRAVRFAQSNGNFLTFQSLSEAGRHLLKAGILDPTKF